MARQYMSTEKRREQIFEAALQILKEDGAEKLTIKNIAGMLGIVSSGIYKHYGSKEKIVELVLLRIREEMKSEFIKIVESNDSPIGKLDALVRFHSSYIFEKLGASKRFVTLEILIHFPEMKSIVKENMKVTRIMVAGLLSVTDKHVFNHQDVGVDFYTDEVMRLIQFPIVQYSLFGDEFDVVDKIWQDWLTLKKIIFIRGYDGI